MKPRAERVGNLRFLGRLWKNKTALRTLLSSENFVFIRDFGPGHFYSPIPDLDHVAGRIEIAAGSSVRSLPGLDLNEECQLKLLESFARSYGEIPFTSQPRPDRRYYFDNPFFSFGDAVVLFCMLRAFQPRRIIEIGSGFSSAEMLDLNDLVFNRAIELAFIEPHPERLYSLLSEADRGRCSIRTQSVQQVELDAFRALQANDVLFVDSSHVGKARSDVLHLLFQVLPLLHAGVLVHFHDVFWPFEYPKEWFLAGRAWNEAYYLRAFLQVQYVLRDPLLQFLHGDPPRGRGATPAPARNAPAFRPRDPRQLQSLVQKDRLSDNLPCACALDVEKPIPRTDIRLSAGPHRVALTMCGDRMSSEVLPA